MVLNQTGRALTGNVNQYRALSLMVDFFCEFGGDILTDQHGGIVAATGWDEARQFIERVLLNNPQETLPSGKFVPPDYIWHPEFGLGLKKFLGERMIPDILASMRIKCIQSVLTSVAVAQTPPPIVVIEPNPVQRSMLIYIDVFLKNQTQNTVALEITP